MTTTKPTRRFHRGSDGWGRGSYAIPATAIVGSSYCGEWSGSPARSGDIQPEFQRFRREVLRPLGIRSRRRYTRSGNLFMVKVWLCVPSERWAEAAQAATNWLANHDRELRYLHDADLN